MTALPARVQSVHRDKLKLPHCSLPYDERLIRPAEGRRLDLFHLQRESSKRFQPTIRNWFFCFAYSTYPASLALVLDDDLVVRS